MPLYTEKTLENQARLLWGTITDILVLLDETQVQHVEWLKAIASFGGEKRKKEYLAVRLLIAEALNTLDFDLCYDVYGKPYLKQPNCYISITHSSKMVAILLHSTKNNGLDIEMSQARILSVQRKFLAPEELTFFEDDAFKLTAAWCIKEAVYKWYGRKEVDFKRDIRILDDLTEFKQREQMALNDIPVSFKQPDGLTLVLFLSLIVLKDHVFAYVFRD